ncbi:hypothetical protein GBA52_026165 [Prunus armeniaca]|nr:hypothetical protein GBA52_026165 [Prunus armeniaca]
MECVPHSSNPLAFASVTLIIRLGGWYSLQFALLLELCGLHHLFNKCYIMAISDEISNVDMVVSA